MDKEETGAASVETNDVDTGVDAGNADAESTTTPQEIAEVLKGSGMKVNVPTTTSSEEDEADDELPDDTTGDAASDTVNKPTSDATKPAPAKLATTDKSQTPEPTDTKEFSLTIVDADGVSFKVNAGDNIDEVLADFNPKNTAQVMQLMRDLDKLEGEKTEYEKTEAKKAEEAETAERVAEIQQTWATEIQELQAAGRLDKAADASSARTTAIYAHMGEENAKRMAAGRPQISSIEDALNSLEIKEAKEAEITAAKEAKETARKNGALVGGSSAPASSGAPAYRPGARNIDQALKQLNLT